MTRCECLEVSFELLRDRILRTGETSDQVVDRTGCGSLCTACLPDLRDYLARTTAGVRAA